MIQPRSFARLDISADFDDEIPEPSTDGKVSQKLKTILGFTDEWAKTPDYQRARSLVSLGITIQQQHMPTTKCRLSAHVHQTLAVTCGVLPHS